jgi:hypothetical protein
MGEALGCKKRKPRTNESEENENIKEKNETKSEPKLENPDFDIKEEDSEGTKESTKDEIREEENKTREEKKEKIFVSSEAEKEEKEEKEEGSNREDKERNKIEEKGENVDNREKGEESEENKEILIPQEEETKAQHEDTYTFPIEHSLFLIQLDVSHASLIMYSPQCAKGRVIPITHHLPPLSDLISIHSIIYITGGALNTNIKQPVPSLFQIHLCEFQNSIQNMLPFQIQIMEKKADMAYSKNGHSSLEINQSALIILGGIESKNKLKVCEQYDIIKDSWSFLPELNQFKSEITPILFRKRFVYVFGGEISAKLEMLDMEEGKSWEILKLNEDCDKSKRMRLGKRGAIQISSSHIMIFGGKTESYRQCDESSCSLLHPEQLTKRNLDSIMCKGDYFLSTKPIYYENCLYSMGKEKDIHIYNLSTKEWSISPPKEWLLA